jgi:hypothetical protein
MGLSDRSGAIVSDREEFQEARAAGLRARHETRLANLPIKVPFVAQNIVNQLADLWEVPVDLRQATNDRCDQFVSRLIKAHVETREARAIRKQVAEEIAATLSLEVIAKALHDAARLHEYGGSWAGGTCHCHPNCQRYFQMQAEPILRLIAREIGSKEDS